jgi:hypothetical protein
MSSATMEGFGALVGGIQVVGIARSGYVVLVATADE